MEQEFVQGVRVLYNSATVNRIVNNFKLIIMPNWSNTAYVVEGDAKEVQSLYDLMQELQDMEKPTIENGFGTTWLGCLVDALGEDWENVDCRGSWNGLELVGDILKFNTETAWSPCDETLELILKKFPSLRYYYRTEEPGMVIYETNDSEGKYFPERYVLNVLTPEKEYFNEYFEELKNVFEWMEEEFKQPIASLTDIDRLVEKWEKQYDGAICCLNKFEVVY